MPFSLTPNEVNELLLKIYPSKMVELDPVNQNICRIQNRHISIPQEQEGEVITKQEERVKM